MSNVFIIMLLLMRRIPLPNENEDGWSYDPQSIEHLIEARLRREEHLRKIAPQAPSRKARVAGLDELALAAIWQEAGKLFFESATIPEELREIRTILWDRYEKRIERFQRMPEAQKNAEYTREAESQAVLFADACDKAIARTTGHFADMLTQAVIAKRARRDFPLQLRIEIWAECLRFAMRLADFKVAGQWVDKAWGTAARENVLPHIHRLDTMAEQSAEVAKFAEKFRVRFSDRIRHGSPQWLGDADRRISLRQVLSPLSRDGMKRQDRSKQAVAFLLTVSADLSAEQVCGKLDSQNAASPNSAPLPSTWKKLGIRSWTDAFARYPARVKTFISKIRKSLKSS